MHIRHAGSTLILACLTIAGVQAQSVAYVSNVSGNNVSVVDTGRNTVVGTIPVPGGPTGLAVTPDGAVLFVASQTAGVVSAVSTDSNSVVASINVGPGPTQLAVTPDGARVYVVKPAANAIVVIDVISRTVVANISVGMKPSSVAFNPSGSRAYVSNLLSGDVYVIDTSSQSVVSTIPAASGPSGVAVHPDGRSLYVTNQYAGIVTVHDIDSGVITKSISGFSFPNSISITPDGAHAFVTNGNSGSVAVVDTVPGSIVKSIPTGSLPTSVAFSYDGTRAYVTNQYAFSLSVIDTASYALITSIPKVGVYPIAVATRPAVRVVVQPPPPPPPPCTYALLPSVASYSYPASGGAGFFEVTTTETCAWSVGNVPAWMSVSPANGSGPGKITYSLIANASPEGRSAILSVAGQQVTVSQSGLVCSYLLSSQNTAIAAGGGTGTVSVTAPAGCAWSALSDSAWLKLANSVQNSGAGVISFSVEANNALSSRNGSIAVAGQSLQVTQAGVAFTAIRVNCGGPVMNDSRGNLWSADDRGNRTITLAPIANTTEPGLFQKEAWSTGTLRYQFEVPNGSFGVTLYFAEIYHTQVGQRVFNILINGTSVAESFDILANTVTPNKAFSKTFYTPVTNGRLTIELVPVVGTVKISGIEIQ